MEKGVLWMTYISWRGTWKLKCSLFLGYVIARAGGCWL